MAGALRPQFFSVLNELVRGAKQKMTMDEWNKFLQPGRVLKKDGVQFTLRPDELKYGAYAKRKQQLGALNQSGHLDPNQKFAPSDMYDMLEDTWKGGPYYTTQQRLSRGERDATRDAYDDSVNELFPFGETSYTGDIGMRLNTVARYAIEDQDDSKFEANLQDMLDRYGLSLTNEQRSSILDLRQKYKDYANPVPMSYENQYQLPGPKLSERETLTLLPNNQYRANEYHFGGQEGLLGWNRTTDRNVIAPGEENLPEHSAEEWLLPRQSGQRATNIEESQSDLHQKGREIGYAEPYTMEDARRMGELRNLIHQHRQAVPPDPDTSLPYNEYAVARNQWSDAEEAWRHRLFELQNELQDLETKRDNQNLPPQAAFSSNWHEPSMRQALADAVEKNHDWLTWTTGDQQLERWNHHLQENVSRVAWARGDKGTITLTPFGKPNNLPLDPVVLKTPNDVREYLGSHMADQINNDPNVEGLIEGDNLSIGGTGMRKYYDTAMGSYGKKLSQQYGGTGQVERVAIPKSTNWHNHLRGYGNANPIDFDPNTGSADELAPWFKRRVGLHLPDYQFSPEVQKLLDETVYHHQNWHNANDRYNDFARQQDRILDNQVHGTYDEEEADRTIAELQAQRDLAHQNKKDYRKSFNAALQGAIEQVIKENPGASSQEVWGIRLTPEMKANIRKAGLPLFSTVPLAAGAAGLSDAPAQEDPDLPPMKGYARGGLTRFATGGSSGNTLTVPPANITVTPYPMDTSVYGLGPAHQFINYDYGATAPPPAPPPPPAPGTGGGGTGGTGTDQPPGPNDYWHGAGSGSGIYQGGNAGGAQNADHARTVADISRVLAGQGDDGYVSSDDLVSIPDWANKLWSAAATALPFPYGTILGLAKTATKGYNMYQSDAARESLGIPGLGLDQILSGMLGIRNYGSLTNATIANPEQSPYYTNDDEGNRLGIAITGEGQPYHEGWFGWGDPNPGGTIGLDKANYTRQAELGQGIFGNVLTPEGLVPSLNAIPTKPAAPTSTPQFTPGQVTRAPVSEGTPTSPQMQPIYRGDGTLVGYKNLTDGSYTNAAAEAAGANGGGSGSYMSSHAGESGNSYGGYGGSYGPSDHTAVGASGQLGHIKRGGLTQLAPKKMAKGGVLNSINQYLGDVQPAKVIPFPRHRIPFNPELITPQQPAVDPKTLLQDIIDRNTDKEPNALGGTDDVKPEALPGILSTYPGASNTSPDTPPAADATADPDYLKGYYNRLRMVESGGNPNAVNKTSGATGWYQFMGPTWEDLVKRYPQAGLSIEGIKDARQQETAVNLLTNEHLARLRKSNAPINDVSLYAMHLLGASGGDRFIRANDVDPDAPITRYVSPGAYSSNPGLFKGKDGRPLTVKQVWSVLQSRFAPYLPHTDPLKAAG